MSCPRHGASSSHVGAEKLFGPGRFLIMEGEMLGPKPDISSLLVWCCGDSTPMPRTCAAASEFHRMSAGRQADRGAIISFGLPGFLSTALVLSIALLPNTTFAQETVLLPAGAVWK